MCVVALGDHGEGVYAEAEDEANHIISEHSWVRKITLRLLMLLICLCSSQSIKEETSEEKQEPEQVGGCTLVSLFRSLMQITIISLYV